MPSKNDFEEFQKYFKAYQRLFGVTGYKVYFEHAPLEGCYADITVTQANMVATVRLNSKEVSPNVKRSAKHEAIHLLLQRLEDKALCRFGNVEEIYESVEEIVFKLEELIPEIEMKENG